MESTKKLILFTLCTAFCLDQVACDNNERQIYIVYMGELPEETNLLTDVHHEMLLEAIGDEIVARKSKIYSYTMSFNGFAAQLLPHEAELLSQKEGIVSVFPNRLHKPLTTRSWDFIGFPETVKRNTELETNTIIAVLDTGIWVDSPSFNDTGFGPPPSKWKGKCTKGANFTGCNNKVIGAQAFNFLGVTESDFNPLDTNGHGTHTASTAGGVGVEGASLYGIAKGTARGAVPAARIASYKVCWDIGCFDADILAAFDTAIADGVDVISVSLGAGGTSSLFTDAVSIGAFHGLKKGILTVCAGGNDGPSAKTVQNVAPWVVTVAATTIDRKFEASVKLGNGENFTGPAINTYAPKKNLLTSGYKARNLTEDPNLVSSVCFDGTMVRTKVEGKIVYCRDTGGDVNIQKLGGAGTIMVNHRYPDTAFPIVTPGTYVGLKAALRIEQYINTTRQPQAVIYKTRSVKTAAPAVASFSSRGPQQVTLNLLKPDISAPGVNILAAYSKYTTVTGHQGDARVVMYNLESGTSMATPHVSGAASYIKSFHPDWSPAAIKSALMTTSTKMKIEPLGAELASGSGQISPTTALHPGLIYDIDTVSYISFLCKQGIKDKDIALITQTNKYNCSSVPRARGSDGLNYPSMHLLLKSNASDFSGVFYRSVTNVESTNSTYKATITSPKGLSIQVNPSVLQFNKPKQQKSFTVTVKGKAPREQSWNLSGSLLWTDSKHYVRSPILVASY